MQFLPPKLLSLFKARDPIKYKPPVKRHKKPLEITGVSDYISFFENPKKVDYSQFKPIETKAKKKERLKREREEKAKIKLEKLIKQWEPKNKENKTLNPYKTLFVARLNYTTNEDRLKREFEQFGPITKVRIVVDKITKKSRGYGFIEFERERDMKSAYKRGDGKKIDGVRVLVDKERGRVDPKWKPRYLGGGLGKTRLGGTDVNIKYSGRAPPKTYDDYDRQDDRYSSSRSSSSRSRSSRGYDSRNNDYYSSRDRRGSSSSYSSNNNRDYRSSDRRYSSSSSSSYNNNSRNRYSSSSSNHSNYSSRNNDNYNRKRYR